MFPPIPQPDISALIFFVLFRSGMRGLPALLWEGSVLDAGKFYSPLFLRQRVTQYIDYHFNIHTVIYTVSLPD